MPWPDVLVGRDSVYIDYIDFVYTCRLCYFIHVRIYVYLHVERTLNSIRLVFPDFFFFLVVLWCMDGYD